jgi:hypothetical protein
MRSDGYTRRPLSMEGVAHLDTSTDNVILVRKHALYVLHVYCVVQKLLLTMHDRVDFALLASARDVMIRAIRGEEHADSCEDNCKRY